jgi:hypothetical protein
MKSGFGRGVNALPATLLNKESGLDRLASSISFIDQLGKS